MLQGQTVRVKLDNTGDWKKAEVTQCLPFRSYEVQLEDGTKRRRTSKHIRASNESPVVYHHVDDTSTTSHETAQTSSSASAVDINQTIPPASVPVTNTSVVASTIPSTVQSSATVTTQRGLLATTRSGRQVKLPSRYLE